MRVRVERRDSHRRPITALGIAGRSVAVRGVLAGVLLFAVLGLVSCGSENPGTVAGSTTTNPGSTPTVIDPYTGNAAQNPDIAACLLLADTVGLDGLVPIDSSSWRDERERILVDAQRESTLLRLAVRGASPELASALETLATHAERVAEEISQATSYTDAMNRLESTGVGPELRAAADAVAAWRDTNC
jgi:hypothetical protein